MNIASVLQGGGVGVVATDTLYGVVGKALDRQAVERIYAIKGRRPDKPLIILISKVDDVRLFGVPLDRAMRLELQKYWPGPVSVIVLCLKPEFEYLHRGTDSLAFRLPAKQNLRRLIAQTGPLVAPSANPEGVEPAATIGQARAYFGDRVDFYRYGRTVAKASKLIRITSGNVEVLRP